ncbi:hypothetical protein FCV25MIE_21043 [Fagus crenata]
MRGKGVSRGHSQAGTSFGKKSFKSGETKGNLDDDDDVVLIDVDSDMSSNVIIIDVPDKIQENLKCSSVQRKDTKFPHQGVISIDDDESDVMDHPGIGEKGCGELDSDATSSKRSCPASNYMQNSVDLDGDECRVVHEKRYSFKLSKCKQMYSRKAPSRNRYGLESDSESGSSDSDYSDCELMEGSCGKLHEQWKKAYLKRKHDLHNGQSGLDDQTSFSGSHADTRTDFEEVNRTEKQPEVPVCSSSSSQDHEKENLSAFFASGDGYMGGTSFSPGMESPFEKSDQRLAEDPPLNYERQSSYNVNGGGSGFCHGEQSHQMPPSSTAVLSREKVDEFCQAPSSCNTFDETHVNLDLFLSNEANGNEEQVNGVGNGFCNTAEETFFCSTPLEGKSEVSNGKTFSEEREKYGDVAPVCGRDIINEREKLKETDEYKRAIEEEWASRQRQLQIQAVESQRLRKRRRDERRLLDMQRRQKQRVEEVRETQKKDEENMNLKEQFRVEISKELNKLEMTCIDMASLLRGLGIHVGGGSYPLSQEVHTAYKRAVLKFHPDRASKTDIYQQVEAEEKFKLISRMKEKFLSTPCY